MITVSFPDWSDRLAEEGPRGSLEDVVQGHHSMVYGAFEGRTQSGFGAGVPRPSACGNDNDLPARHGGPARADRESAGPTLRVGLPLSLLLPLPLPLPRPDRRLQAMLRRDGKGEGAIPKWLLASRLRTSL